MKRVICTICLMLLLTSGCTEVVVGSKAIQAAIAFGPATTAMAFDKQIYEMLKDEDWFMIDPKQYMPESYKETNFLKGCTDGKKGNES